MRRIHSTYPLVVVLVGALAISSLGCGFHDNGLTIVSGSVTYQGQPIPAGVVAFEPNSSEGGAGPADYAVIENGYYITPQGVMPGSMNVFIRGYDGVAIKDEIEGDIIKRGTVLFDEYETTVTVDAANPTIDFNVP